MSRKVFLVLCIVSVVLFFLLVLLTLLIWVLANLGGVLFLLLSMGSEDIRVSGISLAEFLENFVGSPMFYIFLADISVFAISVTGLIAVKKPPKQQKNTA